MDDGKGPRGDGYLAALQMTEAALTGDTARAEELWAANPDGAGHLAGLFAQALEAQGLDALGVVRGLTRAEMAARGLGGAVGSRGDRGSGAH